MRKIAISIICMFCGLAASGQSVEEGVVRQFGNNLRDWCKTENFDYRERAQKLCLDRCRVIDEIMKHFVSESPDPELRKLKDYKIESYLNGFQKLMDRGAISINITNIKLIERNEGSYKATGSYSLSKQEKLAKNYVIFSCNVVVSGVINHNIQDTYYVEKGRGAIAKITPYEEETDPSTGRKRVILDFSDLEDTSMLGFSINHDQNFPIGASIIGQFGWFMCSLDFGINLDSKKYLIEKMDITNIMNYSSTRTENDPKMFLTLTPAVFLKYISVGCGIGFAWLDGKEETSERKTTFNDDGSYNGYTGGTTTTNSATDEFMLRPQIKGYIPLSSSCNMSIGVGYDIIPKIKDLNGYNVSIGFHFDFEEWENLFNWW